MYESCIQKQKVMIEQFASCATEELKYQKIIELGRRQPPMAEEHRTPSNIVQGCQSTMYLYSHMENGNIYFETASEALISAGLAVILTQVYSGETPETVLKCAPDYLEALGVSASLTPSRSNGLYSIHLRMKQDALRFLLGS